MNYNSIRIGKSTEKSWIRPSAGSRIADRRRLYNYEEYRKWQKDEWSTISVWNRLSAMDLL